MIKVKKLTDYAFILLSYMSKYSENSISAKNLAYRVNIPVSTVIKVLKLLKNGNFISSKRGLFGGYKILKDPKKISIYEMIGVLEGPISITDCAIHSNITCKISMSCPTSTYWKKINEAIKRTLEDFKLDQMASAFKKFY
jgi:FeS assembly SUF system regulator